MNEDAEVMVPSLIGLRLSRALAILTDIGLAWEVERGREGDRIVRASDVVVVQTPAGVAARQVALKVAPGSTP